MTGTASSIAFRAAPTAAPSPGAKLRQLVVCEIAASAHRRPRSARRARAASAARPSAPAAPPSPRPSPGSPATTRDRPTTRLARLDLPVRARRCANAVGKRRAPRMRHASSTPSSRSSRASGLAHLQRLGAQLGGLARGDEEVVPAPDVARRRIPRDACARSDRRLHARDRELEHVADPSPARSPRRARSPPRSPLRAPANSCTRRPAASGSRAAAGARAQSERGMPCRGLPRPASSIMVVDDRGCCRRGPSRRAGGRSAPGLGLERRLDVRHARAELAQPSPRARGPRRCAGSPRRPAPARGGCRGGRRRARASRRLDVSSSFSGAATISITRPSVARHEVAAAQHRAARQDQRRLPRRTPASRAAGSSAALERQHERQSSRRARLDSAHGSSASDQNRKYRCAIGSTFAGSQTSSSPSARTS